MIKTITEAEPLVCVRYGADQYRPDLVQRVKNDGWVKPKPGTCLWLCPVKSDYDWKRWCEENEYEYDCNSRFYVQFLPGTRIYVIDTYEDLC